MDSSLGSAASRVLNHIRNRTTDDGSSTATIPTELYRCPDQYRREVSAIFRQRPIPLGASSRLSKPGDFFAEDVNGIPVVVVRDEANQTRAFLNVCRHRGAALVSNRSGNCRSFKCPFHGWTYYLNGQLAHIPAMRQCFTKTNSDASLGHAPSHDEQSSSADQSRDIRIDDIQDKFHLAELPVVEIASLIWTQLDSRKTPETVAKLSSRFSELLPDLETLQLENHTPLREFQFHGAFNWKIALEAFLEVYHFQHAHQPYLNDLAFPNLSLTDFFDENCRIIVPLREPRSQQPVLEWANVMYFIFPATFFLVYNDHFAFLSFIPEAINRTRFRYIPFVPKGITDTSLVSAKADLLETILKQDFEILESVQKGLQTQANPTFTFTRLEHVLDWFQTQVKNICSST